VSGAVEEDQMARCSAAVAACVLAIATGTSGCSGGGGGDPAANTTDPLGTSAPQTIRAVDFPQRNGCGGVWSVGYVQACNGSIQTPFSAPVAGTYAITVDAGGMYGVGGWPNMQLLVDGVSQGSLTVAVAAPNTSGYTFSVVGLGAGSHTLAVAFTNDAYDLTNPNPDRNLYIVDVVIGPPAPAAPPPPPPPSYTYNCAWPGHGVDQYEIDTLTVRTDGTSLQDQVSIYGAGAGVGQFTLYGRDATTITFSNVDRSWDPSGYWTLITLPLSALSGGGGVVLTKMWSWSYGTPGNTASTPCVRL
jgi:hypothetical protein